MNLVTNTQNNNTALKMNSQQIAEMLGSRHDNVKRSIEGLVNKGIISDPQLEDGIRSANGTAPLVYVFEGESGKRDSIIAIAQLSPQHTAILVDRWIELEALVANPAPTLPATYLEALKALVNSEEEKVVIQHQLTVAAPKLEYYEQVLDQKELYTISEVAKKNGITAQELNKVLAANGVYDSRTNGKVFKTKFIDKGYGRLITARTGHSQAKLTVKGEIWVTTVAMKTELAVAFLAARQAKNKPKHLDNEVAVARARQARKEAKEALQCPERVEHTQNTIIHIETILKQA